MTNAMLLAIGLATAALAGVPLMAGRRRRAKASPDALDVLGISRDAALAHLAPPPLDLSQPIASEADWDALRAHDRDPAYRAALDQLRQRYRFTDPMLLPNTLRATMDRRRCPFAEAVIAVARDDALR